MIHSNTQNQKTDIEMCAVKNKEASSRNPGIFNCCNSINDRKDTANSGIYSGRANLIYMTYRVM